MEKVNFKLKTPLVLSFFIIISLNLKIGEFLFKKLLKFFITFIKTQ